MSKESASAFLAKVEQDQDLKSKVQALGEGASFEALQDVAAGAGYEITMDDLIAAGKDRAEQSGSATGELSDTQLESVAGGATISIYYSRRSIFITAW